MGTNLVWHGIGMVPTMADTVSATGTVTSRERVRVTVAVTVTLAAAVAAAVAVAVAVEAASSEIRSTVRKEEGMIAWHDTGQLRTATRIDWHD